jgi:hypothetical protein
MSVGSPLLAGKILAAVAAISIPLSILYLYHIALPKKKHLCFFSLPFLWNILLFKGNFNFILGVAISIFCLALLWRNLFAQELPDKKHWWLFIFLLVLLYLAHIVALFLFAFISLTLLLYRLSVEEKYYLNKFRFFVIAILGLVICFTVLSLNYGPGSIFSSSKIPSISNSFTLFRRGDNSSLIPVLAIILALILLSLQQLRKGPLPLLICGVLAIGYIISPADLKHLVRPHERIYFVLVLLLPLCCTNMRRPLLERVFVIIICSGIFLKTSVYVIKHSDEDSAFFTTARNLLLNIPKGKKLMPIEMVNISNHLEAYYLIEKEGYVPTLFSAPYMTVKYRTQPIYEPDIAKLSYETIRKYDYLFVTGDHAAIERLLTSANFTAIDRGMLFGVYKNKLPSL